MFAPLHGTEAILSHALPGGMEGPVTYCASTMPSIERNYGQTGKEALIMVNEIKAFNNYVCGGAIRICQAKSYFLDFSLKTSLPFQVCSNECCRGGL